MSDYSPLGLQVPGKTCRIFGGSTKLDSENKILPAMAGQAQKAKNMRKIISSIQRKTSWVQP
jgi:hypothetical protein